jgi:hypothetical protein
MALPSPQSLELSLLRERDPAGFLARVRPVIERTRSLTKTAEELGVSQRTMYRWAKDDAGLTRGIQMIQRGPVPRGKISAGIPSSSEGASDSTARIPLRRGK